jgi:hypothetical protein
MSTRVLKRLKRPGYWARLRDELRHPDRHDVGMVVFIIAISAVFRWWFS